MTITGTMWMAVFKLLSSKTSKKLLITIADILSHRSDNTVDDEFVHSMAEALDIRIPEHGLPTKPEDGNIFLGEEQLTEIKSKRGVHEKVTEKA